MKRIAVDLAKSVYQVAESVRSGQVVQRKRLNREAFRRYIQEQAESVEWVMEACGTAHYWGRLAQSLGHRVSCCIHVTCGPTAVATRLTAMTVMPCWKLRVALTFIPCR
ncbi:hypothetical protein J2W71_003021 [Pseudomonas sp. 3400]|nr:hypothetical protein [Pseudomonas sp. 3400]